MPPAELVAELLQELAESVAELLQELAELAAAGRLVVLVHLAVPGPPAE